MGKKNPIRRRFITLMKVHTKAVYFCTLKQTTVGFELSIVWNQLTAVLMISTLNVCVLQ